MTRVLLLIPATSYRTADFMRAAERLGLDIAVGSDDPPPLSTAAPGKGLRVPLGDAEAAVQAIVRFADVYPLDAVVGVDDAGVLAAAEASEALRLPHNSSAAVAATRNKAELRRRLAQAGLMSPPYRVVAFTEDPAIIAHDMPYPCIVKPLALAGSRGVMRADDPAAFVGAVSRLHAILQQPDVAAECGPHADSYLVEGFIPGEEIALEGLLTDGRLQVFALFDKPDPLDGPVFEETIYVTPSRLSQERQAEITATADRAALALGLQDGPLHAEFRLNADGVWPIDLAARTIGGLCARALRFGEGDTSLEEIILAHASDRMPESVEREPCAAGVMMVPTPGAGVLQRVEGVDAARRVANIVEVLISAYPGQELVPLPEGGAYVGFLFARADRPQAVEAALREAHTQLVFHLGVGEAQITLSPHAPGQPRL